MLELPTDDVMRFEEELIAHMRDRQQDLMQQVQSSRELNDEMREKLDAAIRDFVSHFKPSQG